MAKVHLRRKLFRSGTVKKKYPLSKIWNRCFWRPISKCLVPAAALRLLGVHDDGVLEEAKARVHVQSDGVVRGVEVDREALVRVVPEHASPDEQLGALRRSAGPRQRQVERRRLKNAKMCKK